jgi:cytochrome c553|tara:strand:+ start:221 stop:844 length:624 start_codon:yes stop_codon:yes gene_type:complete
MKSILLVTLTALSLAGFVQAEGDASAGKDKVMMCGACHGADGNSAVPSFPKLAGQGEKYLIKQMNDIHEGRRVVLTMAGVLDNMSQQDIADIAAYYAAQTGTVGQAKADLVELGERIYRAGNSEIGIAACTACHSPTGEGNAPAGFPKLGGQHAEYIEAQLKAFRTGAEEPEKGRANDGETRIMRDIVSRMSDLEIRAVSSYIQGLH